VWGPATETLHASRRGARNAAVVFFGATSDARNGGFLENFYFWLKDIRAKSRKIAPFLPKNARILMKNARFSCLQLSGCGSGGEE
jgi:hypothetical protein